MALWGALLSPESSERLPWYGERFSLTPELMRMLLFSNPLDGVVYVHRSPSFASRWFVIRMADMTHPPPYRNLTTCLPKVRQAQTAAVTLPLPYYKYFRTLATLLYCNRRTLDGPFRRCPSKRGNRDEVCPMHLSTDLCAITLFPSASGHRETGREAGSSK